LVTETPVLLGELPVAFVGGFEPLQERGLGRPLPCRDRRGLGGARLLAESFDLGSQIGLGVEPGTGYSGLADDRWEGHRFSGGLQFT
jgi:hypothetical protein